MVVTVNPEMKKGLSIVVETQGHRYSAWCPELDVASDGASVKEAKKHLVEAVQCHVETMIENGEFS